MNVLAWSGSRAGRGRWAGDVDGRLADVERVRVVAGLGACCGDQERISDDALIYASLAGAGSHSRNKNERSDSGTVHCSAGGSNRLTPTLCLLRRTAAASSARSWRDQPITGLMRVELQAILGRRTDPARTAAQTNISRLSRRIRRISGRSPA